MSLILDALKRAEHERKSSEHSSAVVETIGQDLSRENSLPEKIQFNWRWILLLLIIGSILALVFFNKQVKTDSAKNEIEFATESNPAVNQIKELAPHMSAVTSQSSIANFTNRTQIVTDLYQQTSSSLPKVEDIQVAQLYAEDITTSSVTGETVALSVAVSNPLPDINDQLPKNLRKKSEARHIADTDSIAFDELSFNQKQLFPSISYSQHNYLGNSASSVVINGELMRAGSRITQDLSIEEIVEDGVIFNFYHKRVSFKALSGWINM